MPVKYDECTLLEALKRYRLGDTDIIFTPRKRVRYREVLEHMTLIYSIMRHRNDVIFCMTSS